MGAAAGTPCREARDAAVRGRRRRHASTTQQQLAARSNAAASQHRSCSCPYCPPCSSKLPACLQVWGEVHGGAAARHHPALLHAVGAAFDGRRPRARADGVARGGGVALQRRLRLEHRTHLRHLGGRVRDCGRERGGNGGAEPTARRRCSTAAQERSGERRTDGSRHTTGAQHQGLLPATGSEGGGSSAPPRTLHAAHCSASSAASAAQSQLPADAHVSGTSSRSASAPPPGRCLLCTRHFPTAAARGPAGCCWSGSARGCAPGGGAGQGGGQAGRGRGRGVVPACTHTQCSVLRAPSSYAEDPGPPPCSASPAQGNSRQAGRQRSAAPRPHLHALRLSLFGAIRAQVTQGLPLLVHQHGQAGACRGRHSSMRRWWARCGRLDSPGTHACGALLTFDAEPAWPARRCSLVAWQHK